MTVDDGSNGSATYGFFLFDAGVSNTYILDLDATGGIHASGTNGGVRAYYGSFQTGGFGSMGIGSYINFLNSTAAAGVPNSCLFVDSADSKLKFKDGGGTVNALY